MTLRRFYAPFRVFSCRVGAHISPSSAMLADCVPATMM